MTTPTPERLRRYAANPMTYFADAIIPAASGNVRLGSCWAPFQREAFGVLARCLLAVATGEKPPYRGVWLERTKGASKDSDVGLAFPPVRNWSSWGPMTSSRSARPARRCRTIFA